MDSMLIILLAVCITLIATLYSCVGHGGASGYIAVLILFGLSPLVIKPTALFLNIIVASIAAIQFYRAGYFRWSIFWPFACTSIPFAFTGGFFVLPDGPYKIAIGVTLLFSAWRLLGRSAQPASRLIPPSVSTALLTGAAIGLVSGLIGVGGGIFLSPLMILSGWARTKETAAVSAFFVLVNSLSGLLGYASAAHSIPQMAVFFAMAAVAGGMTGSYLGSRRFSHLVVQRALSIVLILAGIKLI